MLQPKTRRRLSIALATLAALALIAGIAGLACGARVVGGAEKRAAWDVPKNECTVAVALRDHVPDDQKLITKLYTVPFIAHGYDDARYFVANAFDRRRHDVVDALARARQAGCVVDLYFLTHGDEYARWLEMMPDGDRPKLRLVYDTGAGDVRQADRWLALGARAFVGHRGVNIAPAFYTFFLPAWIRGDSLDDAVTYANARTMLVLNLARDLDLADDDDVRELWQGTEAVRVGDGKLTMDDGSD